MSNEFYPIPTQYVSANESDIIRNLRQYLKNPVGATLSLLTPPAAFVVEPEDGKVPTRIDGNNLHWKLKDSATGDIRLIVKASWTITLDNGTTRTETAQAIIKFKVPDIVLEWYWFPPIDVFVDADGNFSGTVVSSIDENLINPSGADVAITVASISTSIGSASINEDNDVSITVTGLTANTAAHVVVLATATIDGKEWPAQQQIDIRLVVNTIDLENYVTLPAISDFITAGDIPDIPSTAGFITAGDIPDIPSTAGFITAGDIPDIPSTAGFITAGDIPDIPSTAGFITAGDIPAAPDLSAYLTAADISDFITAGDVPDAQGLPENVVTDGDIADFITSGDIPDIPSTAGFITAGDIPDIPSTAGFITIGDVPAFPDLSNYATQGDIPSTAGYITIGDVPDPPVTQGDIPSTAGYITIGDVPDPPVTQGDIPSTAGYITIGDCARSTGNPR